MKIGSFELLFLESNILRVFVYNAFSIHTFTPLKQLRFDMLTRMTMEEKENFVETRYQL